MPKKTSTRPPLMPHAERRRLIEQPFTFSVIEGKTHAGCLINSDPNDLEARLKARTPEWNGFLDNMMRGMEGD